MQINIHNIPFSRYGAYVSVTPDNEENSRFCLHNCTHMFGKNQAFSLELQRDGQAVPCQLDTTPERIVCTAQEGQGQATIYVRDDETLVFCAQGLELQFTSLDGYSYGAPVQNDRFKVVQAGRKDHALLQVFAGQGGFAGPIAGNHDRFKHSNHPVSYNQIVRVAPDAAGNSCVALHLAELEALELAPPQPEADMQAIGDEWNAFLAKKWKNNPEADPEQQAFSQVTWYNLWSSFVRARNVYPHDTMLMGKKFMSSVWSWDHCFNALAMVPAGSDVAWHQFVAPFVLQAKTGALPDMWNPDGDVVRAVTKPPIHGWCFGKLMDQCEFARERLTEAYAYLTKQCDWWFTYRDEDGDGLPAYPQGCDSGWDNSTVFDDGYFMATPELSAFLVLQMRTLARIATKLGDAEAAKAWLARGEALLQALLSKFWKNDRFVAVHTETGNHNPEPSSLLTLMPLVLGDLLPRDVIDACVRTLKERFLTEHGLATEAHDSPRYQPDGYWRGPIWAPTTYLLVDGLRRAGQGVLAQEIARRYVHMSCSVAKGNYENFDALTGLGRRDPGYTWSASVFMLLAAGL